MTEEEKSKHRALKARTIERLRGINLSDFEEQLNTDKRLRAYVCATIDAPDSHNLYELLALERFFYLCRKYRWAAKRVVLFYNFYERLRFNGTDGRRSYKLTPIQCFQFASIFGFIDEQGRRLTRTAYIFVPRKFGKTTSVASLAVYELLFGDHNAQAYTGANSYQQAKICFDEIRAIMRDLDPREKHFRVNREKITFRGGGRDSSITCLAANARTLDGLNASLFIQDEYAQARDTSSRNGADLKNTVTSSMGARKEPLTVIITTASDVVSGPFVRELEGVKAVLRGEVANDRVFASLFMPDVDDLEDDPATWAKVQPHLGVTVQPDYYALEWENAKLSAENLMVFRTKLLNVFAVNEQKTWFTPTKAAELMGDFDITRVQGMPACAVAFDLSVRDDFSAVSYTLYSPSNKHFYTHTDYYFPEGALPHHPNENLYREWAAQGHLTLCKGDRIDVRQIANDIFAKAKRVKIIRIGYDAWKSQDLTNLLSSIGARYVLQPFSQTYGNFNLAVESFEMLAYDTPPRITFNRNPINAYCLANCVIDTDRLENKKPIKGLHTRKIDGTITMLMTIGLLSTYEN